MPTRITWLVTNICPDEVTVRSLGDDRSSAPMVDRNVPLGRSCCTHTATHAHAHINA